MISIVIGKMFINQSVTKNKAVINGKTVHLFNALLYIPVYRVLQQ